MLDLQPLKEALENVQHELATAHSEQERIAHKIETLQAEARGLELFIARHNGHDDEDAATDRQQTSRWRRMSRTDAVEAALDESDRPLGAADITKVLRAKGRDDPRDHVAATLAYLKRKGRVEHHDSINKYSKDHVVPVQLSPFDGFGGGDSP
jgi:hypothetical protein